jgi:hypothetical protein
VIRARTADGEQPTGPVLRQRRGPAPRRALIAITIWGARGGTYASVWRGNAGGIRGAVRVLAARELASGATSMRFLDVRGGVPRILVPEDGRLGSLAESLPARVLPFVCALGSNGRPVRNTSRLAVQFLVLSWVLVGCHSAPPPAPPGSLESVRVPANADLSGVRGVVVSIGAAPADGRLDLLRPDGKVVFTGRVRRGRPLTARIGLPTKDSAITAVLAVPGAPERRLSLEIEASAATGSF